MFSFISFLFTVSFFVVLPLCFSADYTRFTECSLPFECGRTVTNLSYPFWGNGREEYCGHPDFKLQCKDDDIVELEAGLQSYRVLSIDKENNILRITTTEILKDCPSPSQNISLPFPIFNYNLPGAVNLTLAYGCPRYPQLMANNTYPCSADDISGENYYWLDPAIARPGFSNCNLTDTIPVHGTVSQSLDMVMGILKDGFEVRYDANNSFCRTCQLSQGQCGYDITLKAPTCFCYDGQYQGSCPTVRSPKNDGSKLRMVIIGGFSAIGGVILVVTFLLVYYRIKKSGKLMFFRETTATRNFEQFIKRHGSFAPKRYNFKEIKKMTQSFKNKLGHGGYGSVFKGVLNDGRLVAVKVLTDIKGNGEEFINEVASISRTSHVNIVSLLGYCFDGSKRALIYEFMPNGSLEKYIYDKDSSLAYANLGWATLHDISVGIARGLEYLHRGCNTRILHFDIKPHNILLDQDFCPKISDFGLAKLCPRKDSIISMLGTRGTAGYIAPEVFSRNFGSVSHKSDVYSYGMMILEMVGGRKNIDVRVDHTSEIYFPNWIYKRIALNENLGLHGIDSKAQEDIPRKMILVGLWCIQTNPFDRPAMTRVLEMLEGNLNVLEIPPNPYLSSPPRTQGSSSIN